jgi:hypothetical protein
LASVAKLQNDPEAALALGLTAGGRKLGRTPLTSGHLATIYERLTRDAVDANLHAIRM